MTPTVTSTRACWSPASLAARHALSRVLWVAQPKERNSPCHGREPSAAPKEATGWNVSIVVPFNRSNRIPATQRWMVRTNLAGSSRSVVPNVNRLLQQIYGAGLRVSDEELEGFVLDLRKQRDATLLVKALLQEFE